MSNSIETASEQTEEPPTIDSRHATFVVTHNPADDCDSAVGCEFGCRCQSKKAKIGTACVMKIRLEWAFICVGDGAGV